VCGMVTSAPAAHVVVVDVIANGNNSSCWGTCHHAAHKHNASGHSSTHALGGGVWGRVRGALQLMSVSLHLPGGNNMSCRGTCHRATHKHSNAGHSSTHGRLMSVLRLLTPAWQRTGFDCCTVRHSCRGMWGRVWGALQLRWLS
jgi:hypothetical protein